MLKVKVVKRKPGGGWEVIGWVQSLTERSHGPEETAIPVAADNLEDLYDLWHVPFWSLQVVEYPPKAPKPGLPAA